MEPLRLASTALVIAWIVAVVALVAGIRGAPSTATPAYYETVAQVIAVLLITFSLEARVLGALLAAGVRVARNVPRRAHRRVRQSTSARRERIILLAPLAFGEWTALRVVAIGHETSSAGFLSEIAGRPIGSREITFGAVGYGLGLVGALAGSWIVFGAATHEFRDN